MKNKYTMTTDLKALEVYLGSATIIAFDFETVPHEQWKGTGDAALDPHKAHIVGISLSVLEGTGIYIPLCHENSVNAESKFIFNFLKNRVFENPKVLKIAHNLCFEAKFLMNQGIVLALPVYDTMAAAQMTLKDDNHFRRLGDAGLKTLASEIFKISLPGFNETVGEKSFGDLDPNDQKTIDYACADADMALRLYHALNRWFEKNIPSHEGLIRTLESPVALFVAMMEKRGF
ncbi:MAG TPA: bifunctional 3'-5' exonuclease/DNA polymerase, partial [Acetobacterium sp.]